VADGNQSSTSHEDEEDNDMECDEYISDDEKPYKKK